MPQILLYEEDMSLNEIKARQLNRLLKAQTELCEALVEADALPEPLEEGKKKRPHTPEFVRHCVAAITEKPEDLARIEQKKDGSPFGICWSKYKKNKRSLAAKHSKGEHHTAKDYESALATLRNETREIRESRPSRKNIVFEEQWEPRGEQRSQIRFSPKE